MQIDELRGELTRLAGEMDAFPGDVDSLHRRERRRRTLVSSVAVVVAAVVGVSTIAALRHDDNGKVKVTGTGPKEVPVAQISRIDVVVVPATPEVQAVLDASPLVARYARASRDLRGATSLQAPTGPALCALERTDGFGVQARAPGSDIAQVLTRELATRATVYDVSDEFGFDAEVFLKIGTPKAAADAVRARLESDHGIASVQYLSPTDAYAIFKKEFADQPELVNSVKPSDLPASFRIDVTEGTSIPDTVRRYEQVEGVTTVISGRATYALDPTSAPGQRTGSACAKATPATTP